MSQQPDYITFDEVDTRSALRQVRSAIEGMENADVPSIRLPFVRRKLSRVETLLMEHAKRNDFDV